MALGRFQHINVGHKTDSDTKYVKKNKTKEVKEPTTKQSKEPKTKKNN